MVKAKASIPGWSSLIPIMITILLLSGTVAKAEVTPQYGGVLKIIDVAEGGQPLGTPWEVRGVDSNLIKPVIESLLREDINGNYHPMLATEWKIDQTRNTITLSLRKGVKFHDGTNLDAEAVKWSLDKAIEAKMVKGFKSVDVIDEYTVRINVDQYQNNMLNLLSGSTTSPVSPTAYKNKGKEWAMWNPVGTGPFKFVNYERGNKLTFTKWEGYWEKGRPYLDGIEFLFIRDPMTQQAAMQARGAEKIHVLAVSLGEQAAMMKAMGFKILSLYTGTVSLIPDSNNPESPLSKKMVREAISYAINREAIAKARGFGFWAPANQVPPPGKPGYVKESEFGRYDPKKAKQLLTEAGYPNGFKIKNYAQPALVDRDTMVVVQRYLGEVGIQLELEFPDGGGYTALRFKDGWHNGFLAQAVRILATTNITYNFFWHTATGHLPSLKRPEGFVNKIDASLNTLAPEKNRMEELTRIMIDEAMIIPVYHISEFRILQSNVHDTGYFEWEAGTVYTPEKMWLSK